MTIAIKPDTYEQYKILKAQGYTWNAIITQGIIAINEQNNAITQDQLADKFQKQLTAIGSENELLRMRIKRQELRDKLENGEINQDQYEQFKKMYDESIINIERRSGEERRQAEE
jgi:hypothetical protein